MAGKKKLILVLAVLLAAGAYLYVNMGGMITRTAEKIASDALGVKVSIGSIDVSLSDKKVTVSTLKIANPPGYRNAHAMTADKILIGLNTASRELIDFKDIQVKGSVVNLEANEKGINLRDLRNLANSKEQKESPGSKQIRVIIQHMVIDASTINAGISIANRPVRPIRMPAMTFNNMGSGGGVEAGDVIAQILGKYLSTVQSTATSAGLLEGLPGVDDGKGILDNAGSSLKKLFD